MEWYLATLTYLPFLLDGLKWTIVISVGAMAGGTIIGLLCAVGRDSELKFVSSAIAFYTGFFRSTPPLIQLLWIYYALPVLTGYSLNGVQAGLLGMSLHAGAYLSEVFRAGISSVGRGQIEACEALGMNKTGMFFRIVLPQAIRNMLPTLTNNMIFIVKDSSLLSFVSVSDVLRNGQVVAAVMQRNMEPLSTVAILYLIVTAPLAIFAHRFERRQRQKERRA